VTRAAIESWLTTRRPARPEALAVQMTRSITSCPDAPLAASASMAAAMGALGIATLASVTARTQPSPQLALELLAADAFVTYAFEAAAEEGVDVPALALHLMQAAA